MKAEGGVVDDSLWSTSIFFVGGLFVGRILLVDGRILFCFLMLFAMDGELFPHVFFFSSERSSTLFVFANGNCRLSVLPLPNAPRDGRRELLPSIEFGERRTISLLSFPQRGRTRTRAVGRR